MTLSDKLNDLLASFSGSMPENWLFIAFMSLIVVELVLYRKAPQQVSNWLYPLTFGVFVLTFFAILNQWSYQANGFLFREMLFLDGKAIFFKGLIVIAAMVMLLHAWLLKYRFAGEYFPLLIGMLLGLFLLTMAVNLLMLFLSIEIVSVASYLLTAFQKDRKSAEGAIKYALFGTISAAVMLYGMSLLYGLTGTLNFVEPEFTRAIAQADSVAVIIAILFTVSGFLFKISAVPFHIWNPDVYESAPTPVVSFFSVAPKAAALLALIRFLSTVPTDIQQILALVAILSLTVGNFSALWQTNLKRLLAYSSIAQAGFMLVGLVAFSEAGLKSTVFYIATYLFISMAAFFLVDMLRPAADNKDDYSLISYHGLGQAHPWMGVLVVVVMMALVGLPLTVGFSAKLFVFSALYEAYEAQHSPVLLILLAFGLLNAAVSLFYYLRLPFVMFFRLPDTSRVLPSISLPQQLFAWALVIPIIVLFFKADWMMNMIVNL